MKSGRPSLFVLVAILGLTSARIYDRCDLARELRGRPDVAKEHVPTWVCIAFHESRFDTSAIGRANGDRSWDHGLFQLNDRYWCGRDAPGGVCRIPCSALRDQNISDDLRCAKAVFDEHRRISGDGFNAWTTYGNCKGYGARKFVEGCF
ncbi:lysozyme C-like [Athalia rosae]|uniref:lysozyme C-like n=1 Tax=Athalia rosae TaxID=37344 RepID=UPI002033E6C7|nr:lysozyme C-like [Athalia rosae]